MTVSKDKFREYAKLKQKKKDIENRLDELKPQLQEEMEANDGRPIESDQGKFSLVETTVGYEYPDAIRRKEAQVAKQKQQAKANGTAEPQTTTYVKFTPDTNNE